MGGRMSVTGEKDEFGGTPQKAGVALADIMTGLYSTIAILGALHQRDRSGAGQYIDMALLDVQVATLANQALYYLVSGNVPVRMGHGHAAVVPYQGFPVADGFVLIPRSERGRVGKGETKKGRSRWWPDIEKKN